MIDKILDWVDKHEILGGVTILVIAFLVVIFGVYAVISPFLYVDCVSRANIMDVDYKYSVLSGCYFEVADGSFIHEEYYRGVETLE